MINKPIDVGGGKNMLELTKKHCVPCNGGISSLTAEQANVMLQEIPIWQVSQNGIKIYRCFQFKNFYHTIAFVNAIAWLSHQEEHHPHLEIDYNKCIVEYWTHAIEGLSENDFICAAKIDSLYLHQE
ncbi:MAG: 4a-hydroxytetrahydrobiopterin dehydratase [Gammaproteobacteria bacterium]|jgi:4a-hydroxytetrahydrobiopterin dehydratase